MQETYLKQSTNEQVPLERWFFVALYNDGTELRQFDDRDNSYHSFPEIDQSKLSTFKMINSQTKQAITMLFPQNAKLIHIYRNINLNVGTEEEKNIRWYCFGYETPSGINCKFIITGEDEVIFTDDFDKIGVE